MTVVIGLLDSDGTIWMGGDSAGTAEDMIDIRKTKKVFYNHDFLIGFAGSYKLGLAMEYQFKPPVKPKSMDITKYMNTLFINEMHKCFNWKMDFNQEPHYLEAHFLIGYQKTLFNIDIDLHVGESVKNYMAIGKGAKIALGAMFATEDMVDSFKRIELALNAAEYFNNTVHNPFYILKL